MGITTRMDSVIDQALDEARIVGVVAKIYRDGDVLYERAAGFADREAEKPTRYDTIFRLASVTKPFVAAAALAMIDTGKFMLDDRVTDLLPWFHPPGPDGRLASITVRHLLTHTSGLTYRLETSVLPEHQTMTVGIENTDLTLEENFSCHNIVPLAFQPGTSWEYSISIDILGAILAEIHGGSVEEVLAHYIFKPLGITDTGFHVADKDRISVPYVNDTPEPRPMDEPERVIWPNGMKACFSPARIFNTHAFQGGGGGMAGTAGDVVTLLEMFRKNGVNIISPESAQAACRNQIGDFGVSPGVKFGFIGSVMDDSDLAQSPLPNGVVYTVIIGVLIQPAAQLPSS